ncbi:MAG: hypothetical protein IJD92_04195 [Bacilli bacterium]|nr:hypothetical protein [Bacilli bacterium]
MNGINYLFNETSLYTKEVFKIFVLNDGKYEYDKKEFLRFIYYVGYGQDKLVSYCHLCKKEFPFSYKTELFEFTKYFKDTDYYMIVADKDGQNPGRISISDGIILGLVPPYDKELLVNNKIWYMNYFFNCTRNGSHKYMMMISIELKDGNFIVRKIGQNPSMLTVKGFDFDKYKKVLEKLDAYEDYKKADLSNADHFHVGAYAYLRRIFEKMINQYLGKTELKDDHMDTKIDAVKDYFDPRIKNLLKNLYGILSVGIHELSEEQSKEYYEYLKAIIDMQLEYVQTENDKDKQSKELAGVLSKITNLITKQKKDY